MRSYFILSPPRSSSVPHSHQQSLKMQGFDDKLCLQWNDFGENIKSSFKELRKDQDCTDVTLACEDGQEIETHKVVLIASSPIFCRLLKKNKHSQSLIYMRGVKSEILSAMVDFFYCGEANIFQNNLDSFLGLADELHLSGLRKDQLEDNVKQNNIDPKQMKKELKQIQHLPQIPKDERSIVPSFDQPENKNIQDLDLQVKSMMSVSETRTKGKSRTGKARICNACGKEGQMAQIMQHIEKNHITEVAIPCNDCGMTFPSRNGLASHKFRQHTKNRYSDLLEMFKSKTFCHKTE